MYSDLASVQQMSDLTNQFHLLIAALFAVGVTIAGVFGATMKWYIPARFKQQTEGRKLELDALREEFINKNAAEKVDIERDRMLPQLLENMMQSNRSTIQLADSFHATVMQSLQQTAAWNAQLKAHDGQLTANTDRLEEMAQTVETAITVIQVLKKTVEENTDLSKTAAAFSQQAAVTAQETLELVKDKIVQAVAQAKHDTSPLPPLTDVVKEQHAETSAGEGSAAA